MTTVEALNADNITAIGVGVIVALVVLGAALSFVITAILGRVVIGAVIVVLAIVVWQQRGHVKDSINSRACNLNTTFFGFHVDPPAAVKQACASRG